MSIANGTEAKEILFYFASATGIRIEPHFASIQMTQIKRVLSRGYSKPDIIKAIKFTVLKGIHLYSFGFIEKSIDDLLKQIEVQEIAETVKEEMAASHAQEREVNFDDASAERNRDKLHRFGSESRLREKYNFDLLEEQ